METVCSVCNITRQQSKHGTSFQKLLATLRREFKKQGFELTIKSHKHKSLNPEEFFVNAYYDAYDERNNEIPIEVVVHNNFDKTISWDHSHVTELLIQIFDAVVHECKHQRQSRKRQFKDINTHHNYLDDPDEIDAYSVSIAIELCRTLGKHRALRYLSRFSSISRLKIQNRLVSPNINAYIESIGTLPNPIIKKLAKKVYVRVQKLDTDMIFL